MHALPCPHPMTYEMKKSERTLTPIPLKRCAVFETCVAHPPSLCLHAVFLCATPTPERPHSECLVCRSLLQRRCCNLHGQSSTDDSRTCRFCCGYCKCVLYANEIQPVVMLHPSLTIDQTAQGVAWSQKNSRMHVTNF